MDLLALVLKYVLVIFSAIGIAYHLFVLRNPSKGNDLESKLGVEYGIKTRISPKLEEKKMDLHERLIRSKGYNLCSIAFLVIVLIVLIR